MKKLLAAMIAAMAVPTAATAGIVINEVMQSNVYCIMDDINEFPDSWVELYNSGDTDIDLKGYRIGTKDKVKKCYKLPSAVVPAGGLCLSTATRLMMDCMPISAWIQERATSSSSILKESWSTSCR